MSRFDTTQNACITAISNAQITDRYIKIKHTI